ncbi:MAG: siderophore-interacting protein [Halioglobus sp.]
MAKGPPRELDVLAMTDITPNMRRITLGGPGLSDFPANQEGAYIKLMLDEAGQPEPCVRTYTVRHQRQDASEIDVDFVMHGDHGIASRWANRASIGDRIRVGGPGPRKMPNMEADWFFLAADMTALPALSVNLEAMSESVTGYAVIEILHADDRQKLDAPAGIEIDWVVAAQPEEGRAAVIESIRAKPWLAGRPAVWAASEFDTMRAMRLYFKKERGLPTVDAYISSYWKRGIQEDEHKRVKRQDSNSADA